jgi:hypothetical protein
VQTQSGGNKEAKKILRGTIFIQVSFSAKAGMDYCQKIWPYFSPSRDQGRRRKKVEKAVERENETT